MKQSSVLQSESAPCRGHNSLRPGSPPRIVARTRGRSTGTQGRNELWPLHRVIRRLCYLLLLTVYLLAFSGCGSTAKVIHTAHPTSPKSLLGSRLAVSVRHATNGPVKPVRLIVPAININASIESLGILPNGDLATPTQSPWTDVGWYNQGPRPGEHGSSVIDGHLDRPGGYPAVFWNLRNMQPGDEVIVMYNDGTSRHFKTTRVAAYPPQDAPIQDIFGNINGSYLNLITCAGDWIPSEHQTTLRLVVYTTLM